MFEAIGHLDDDLILAADAPVKKRRRPPVYWRSFAAAAACACIFLGGITVWQRSAIPRDAVMLSAQPPEAAAAETDTDEAMADTAAPQTAGDAEANEGQPPKALRTPPNRPQRWARRGACSWTVCGILSHPPRLTLSPTATLTA